jgi:hypothetical protein
MSLLSKRLVGIAASTILLSLVSAAAYAQGTWYTDREQWQSLVTNIGIATYDGVSKTYPENRFHIENNVRARDYGGQLSIGNGYLTTVSNSAIRFDYSDSAFHAFCGDFSTSSNGSHAFEVFDFNGEPIDAYSLTTSAGADSFLGYISTSGDIRNIEIYPGGDTYTLRVNSFNLGNRKTLDPSANVAPEPGSFALALTGGAALLGICIRRRRNAA